jgi:hypothetical protein
MTPGVRWYLVSSVVLFALIALAGCSHYMFAEREPWRREAEAACLNSGAVKESATRVRISSINGPGVCGMDYPLKVTSLGDSGPLGYDDEPVRPPSSIPNGAMPQHWPVVQSSALPPPQSAAPQQGGPQYGAPPYGSPQYASPQYPSQQYPSQQYPGQQDPAQPYGARPAGAPLSLTPQGQPPRDYGDENIPGGPPHPYYGGPAASPAPSYSRREVPPADDPPPLGPAPMQTAAMAPVELKPAATLACPIVSALDQWITGAVQPAALRWFRQPVVEIKQISAYSCRGMNGNPNAHISEHAFGNALDVAEFDLADGHRVIVQYGWHGSPEEQGFLHDVQGAACEQFTTVLAPGANVYHYNHIHVDLMRHAGGRHICEPSAIPGEVAAAKVREHYAAQHYGDPGVTGSVRLRARSHSLSYSGEDDDRLPLAEPGED